MSNTDNFSYDPRYDPPEYYTQTKGKSTIHTSHADIWRFVAQHVEVLTDSLGLLIWQVLNAKALPVNFDAQSMKTQVAGGEETNLNLKHLFDEILFAPKPSKRVRASEIAQQLLDQYNDSCVKMEDHAVASTFQRCRSMIDSRRLDHTKEPGECFSESDICTLMGFDDSWDDFDSGLCLAPQAMFLIGAGVMWDLIPFELLHLPATIVSRGTTNPKGTALD